MAAGRPHIAGEMHAMEPMVRKLSNARSRGQGRDLSLNEQQDTRPRNIPGATVTSWHGPLDVNLDAFFAQRGTDTTVTGAAASRSAAGTVSLSDGTRITFLSPDQFNVVETV